MDYITYCFFRLIAGILSFGPLSWNKPKSICLGWLYRTIDKKHFLRAVENLKHAFPQKSQAEVITLAKKSFDHLALSMIEVFTLGRLKQEELIKRLPIHGRELLDECLSKGNGIIMATGHIGNWELAGMSMGANGYPMTSIARPIKNKYIHEWIENIRTATGQVILNKFGAVKQSLRGLKDNKIIAVLMDQDSGEDGCFVNFFNRQASTIPFAHVIGQKTKSPCIIGYVYRDDEGTNHIAFEGPFELASQGSKEENIQASTQRLATALEQAISKHPEQWLWSHRRWKTQPPEQNKGNQRA